MADDRAAHGAPGSASPVPAFGFRPPPTLTPFMAVIAVALPATGFLAAAAITPDFAEPLFRKFFTGYLALVTTLVIGGMALWRVYLRRNGIPPIRFGTDAVEIPPGAVSHRSVRIPYDQILSAAAMNTLRGDSLVVDARRRPYVFPRKAFEQATAVEDIRRHLRDRILREDGGAARWTAMEARADIAHRFTERRPWITWLVMAAIAAVYIAQAIVIPATDPISIVDFGANAAALVGDGQWFRLIAANLLHVDTVHVVTNVLLIWGFGTMVERQLGAVRFGVLLLASGLAGQALSALLTALQYEGAPSVGASGVLFGMLGAQAVLDYRFRGQMPGFYRLAPALWWIVVILNFVILPLAARAPDNATHTGGLAIGVILGWAFSRGQQNIADHPPSTSTGRVALGTLCGLWLLGIASTAVHGTNPRARVADRGLLGRYALDHGSMNAATDPALARAIALAPGAERKTLEVALALATRAAARQRGARRGGFRRGSGELMDTLSVVNYRLGNLEAAIDLHVALLRQRDTRFINHFARILDTYRQERGVRVLGNSAMQTRTVKVSRTTTDQLSLDVGPGIALPEGARIYALAYREATLFGFLAIDVAPRDESGTRMPRQGQPLPAVMNALADGATIEVVVFDGSGCRCYGDGTGYTVLETDSGIFEYLQANSIR